MKTLTLIALIPLAFAAVSCQTIDSNLAAPSPTPPAKLGLASLMGTSDYSQVSCGMTQAEVKALGRPNYKYSIDSNEVWVYENGNFLANKAKETCFNLIPVAGPVTGLFKSLNPKTKQATAAITFNHCGDVIAVKHAEVCEN